MTPARVLFVDDEPLVLKGLQRLLRRTPTLEVHCCTSGAEALETLARESFAVVVSDWKMPDMNGLAFLQRAAQASPGTHQIVLTGSIGVEHVIRSETRARAVVAKPCSPEQIVRAIEEAILHT